MKIIVTGGRGFIGSYICEKLCALGHEVHTIGRSKGKPSGTCDPKCFHHQYDLIKDTLPDQLLEGADLFFHVAAKAGVWGKYHDFYESNVTATDNIIQYCKAYDIKRLIYTSTPSVVFSGKPFSNDDESLPYGNTGLSAYAKTKAIAEGKILAANYIGKLQTIALRPHLVWGRGDPHLLPRVIERHRRGKLRIVGSGNNLVDLTHIKNVTHAHICAMKTMVENETFGGKAFFIGQKEPVNLWSWLNEVFDSIGLSPVEKSISHKKAYMIGSCLEKVWSVFGISGEPPMTRFVATQLSHDHWFSNVAAEENLGYQPVINMKKALTETLPWLRSLN